MRDALYQRINECMLADRRRLRRTFKASFDAGAGRLDPALRAELALRIQASSRLAEQRQSALPKIQFPSELPITQHLVEVETLLAKHPVVVLCGATGSGKSTQLPKLCLHLGRGVYGRIGHTQPRRIAARSLAQRIARELGQSVGESVGYKVRFHDRVGERTHLKLMTDGILLAEIQQDRFLNEYDTLIIDEAHERSLNIDFLLGYLRQLLPKRPDLKVIVTSATIDPERFSKYFSAAPVIELSGRSYPVEVRYRPPQELGAGERDESMQQAVLDAVDELSRLSRGDILVFLSGEREIRDTAESLRKHRLQATEVLPLYARQGMADQARIFQPSGSRRIVLATNVAETSLTVPGIRYVVDAGFARISRYSHRSKIQRLPIERISQASAEQRGGRCGREANGVCVRLYTEEDFANRTAFTEPEILRTNLASVILQMKVLGFGDIETFPFIEPPDSRQVKDGYRVLQELGAVDGLRKLTQLGRILARLPVDPRVGRILLESAHTHCMREGLILAAALSVQDPRERPLDKQQAADEVHTEFRDEDSDYVGYLKLWAFLEEQRRHLSHRKFRALCRTRFLSVTRVQEWHDTHRQLRNLLHEQGYRDNQVDAGYETIHKAVLSGLLSHIGFRSSGKDADYLGARGTRFRLFPGSGLAHQAPKWVVAAELVETTRLYARLNARVQPEWIEVLAGHLVKHSYSEPHWQGRRGQVAAFEKVTLYGLTLIARRRVNYGPIDPVVSRELFIRHGLVEGDFETRARFWRHNRELIDEVRDLEAKSRRRDILVDEEAIYAFYDARIPDGIYSKPQFEKWLREVTREQPRYLHLRKMDLLRREVLEVTADRFPGALDIGGARLPLEYRFAPGDEADGVTLVVPVAVLRQVTEGRADWLIPGLLREKVVALMKGLPKTLRRHFVPVPDYAERCLAALQPSDTPLIQGLGAQLKQLTGVYVPEDAWNMDAVPAHLRLRIRVIDATGKTLGAGRELLELKKRYADAATTTLQGLTPTGLEREGLTDWVVPDMSATVTTRAGDVRLTAYPALVDCGNSVALRLLDSVNSAAAAHRAGVRRLIMLRMAHDMRDLRRRLPGLQRMSLQYAKAPRRDIEQVAEVSRDLPDQIIALIVDLTFLEERAAIRSRAEFEARLARCKAQFDMHAEVACVLVREVFDAYQDLRKRLAEVKQTQWLASVKGMREQLDGLVFQGFLQEIPWVHLQHYPRYLAALRLRLDRLQYAASRDARWQRELQPLIDEWQQRDRQARRKGVVDPRLEEIRWMLEELRVSRFAQELKTEYPVSVERVRRRWEALGL